MFDLNLFALGVTDCLTLTANEISFAKRSISPKCFVREGAASNFSNSDFHCRMPSD